MSEALISALDATGVAYELVECAPELAVCLRIVPIPASYLADMGGSDQEVMPVDGRNSRTDFITSIVETRGNCCPMTESEGFVVVVVAARRDVVARVCRITRKVMCTSY